MISLIWQLGEYSGWIIVSLLVLLHADTISPGAEIRFNFTSDKEEPRKYTIEVLHHDSNPELVCFMCSVIVMCRVIV